MYHNIMAGIHIREIIENVEELHTRIVVLK